MGLSSIIHKAGHIAAFTLNNPFGIGTLSLNSCCSYHRYELSSQVWLNIGTIYQETLMDKDELGVL